jgi:predicted HTH transcriptional regulator
MIELTDEDLNRMRRDTENNFVERKTVKDKGGWLRTAVAFANSVPVDYPAVLYIGVKDDGVLEDVPPGHNWESQQKTVSEELSRAYPPLYMLPKIVRDEQGREFLAVIIPGSPQRPHFTGKAYIRVGAQTKEASDEEFDKLITQRSSKVYEILKWRGKDVTAVRMLRNAPPHVDHEMGNVSGKVEDCNQFWVTFLRSADQHVVHSLSLTDLSFDSTENRLKLLLWRE